MTGDMGNTGISIDLQIILKGVAQLDTSNLRLFTHELVKILLQRTSDKKQEEEWALIYQIYTIVPPETNAKYEELTAKLEAQTINEAERKTFIALNHEMEKYSAERLKMLMKLAAIREIPLPQVMEQLGLKKTSHV